MSWNIQTPGDYINGPLTVAGVAQFNSNVGVGVAPSAWNSNYNAIDIGANGSVSGRLGASNTVDITSNAFRNSGGDWIYKIATSSPAARYQVDGSSGSHIWYSGAAGTAGNTIAGFSTALMTLNSSGLSVGGISPELKFRVNGPDEAPATSGISTTNGALRIGGANTNLCIDSGVCTSGGIYGWLQSRDRSTYASNYDLVLQKNGGNVGIGVVPVGGKGCLQISSGINFPATQVASTDANTLDDYEEGTWTPSIVGTTTTGVGTYSIQNGKYTKIGNLVTVQMYLTWSAHTGAGGMRVSGLPFQSSNEADVFSAVSVGYFHNIALSANNVFNGYVINGSQVISLEQYPTGGGQSTTIPVDSSGAFILTASYRI